MLSDFGKHVDGGFKQSVMILLFLVTVGGCGRSTSAKLIENPITEDPKKYRQPYMASHFDGIRDPWLKRSNEVFLADGIEVIGVIVANRPRAYVIQAMSSPATHVINDMVGDTPVTVTYCDLMDCARVLTKSEFSSPLNVNVGGFVSGSMSLEIDGVNFPQRSTEIPFDDLAYLRMTWGEWKATYPDSMVFVGITSAKNDIQFKN